MKSKLYLAIAAAIVFCSSINSATAEENQNDVSVSPYVSTKLSFGWAKAHNLSAYDPNSILSFASGGNTDGIWGTKLAIGADTAIPAINGSIRTELELGFNSDYETGGLVDDMGYGLVMSDANVQSKTFLFNVYYDLKTSAKVTHYVGAGLGFSRLDTSMSADFGDGTMLFKGKKSANKLAWQVGAGVAYALNDDVTLDFGYRYTDLGSIKVKLDDFSGDTIPTKADLRSHELLLGLRYTF